jgi:hypothetical protein
MEGDLVFAYIRGGKRRGYHIGRFEWNGQHSTAIGRMRGMINVGTIEGVLVCDCKYHDRHHDHDDDDDDHD